MNEGRLEAFSDGVIAILITIMVLELKIPHGTDLRALTPVLPVFLTYVLSYVYLGIYWTNHHHMLYATARINGRILWANLHLLFWLSLIPFVTGWMGENHFDAIPTAIYGGVLFAAGVAYYVLQTAIISGQGPGSRLAAAVGSDLKGKISPVLYALAIPLAFVREWTPTSSTSRSRSCGSSRIRASRAGCASEGARFGAGARPRHARVDGGRGWERAPRARTGPIPTEPAFSQRSAGRPDNCKGPTRTGARRAA